MRQPSSLISWTQSAPFGGRSTSRQVAKGMKSGSAKLLLARRLPSGAFPASCFLASSFALGLGPRPIAFVALAGLDFGLGTLPPIRGQGPADIVGLNERRA